MGKASALVVAAVRSTDVPAASDVTELALLRKNLSGERSSQSISDNLRSLASPVVLLTVRGEATYDCGGTSVTSSSSRSKSSRSRMVSRRERLTTSGASSAPSHDRRFSSSSNLQSV